MSDLSWCPSCDNAISPYSDSLYCSESCLKSDALRHHPLLGYTYPELTDFPRPLSKRPSSHSIRSSYTTFYTPSSSSSNASTPTSSPSLSTLSSSLIGSYHKHLQ